MAEKLEEVWSNLNLTEEERDCMDTEEVQGGNDLVEGKNWLVGSLLTRRPLTRKKCLVHSG